MHTYVFCNNAWHHNEIFFLIYIFCSISSSSLCLFVIYFFVPINQFMLDKNFRVGCEEEGGGGKRIFILYIFLLSFLNELRDDVKEKKISTTAIYIFTWMLVWYVIRHMNIYIVITRINSELNCLIIMHFSCCLISVFLMMVLHSFYSRNDSRIHQSVTKEQMQKKEHNFSQHSRTLFFPYYPYSF